MIDKSTNKGNYFSYRYDLFRAYYDARRNKRNTWNQLRFEFDYERSLLAMWESIVKREYEIRKSITFIVNEPVKREIFARMTDFMRKCSENYTKDCFVLKLDVKGYFMSMNKHHYFRR